MSEKCISQKSEECCGCGACSVVCPVNAIDMSVDEYGFDVPTVNIEKCINCGECKKKCAFIHPHFFQNEDGQMVYAAALKNTDILKKSASGGVFAGLALCMLNSGGIVYGAAWNTEFTVKHIGIVEANDLCKIQGSKYTQSNIVESFVSIENLLNENKKILFSGTPCQVASLKSFLGKEYKNLITVDLICHGVSNNKLLKDDVKYLEKKYRKKISSISFRSKRNGWGTSGDICFDDNTMKNYTVLISPYYYYYLDNSIFRDSCYSCPFATGSRVGDITLGDYWRVESAHPEIPIDTEKGVSCILVNTKKGKEFIDGINESIYIYESDFEKISKRNRQLVAPCSCPAKRELILNKYAKEGYNALSKYWMATNIKRIGVLYLKSFVPNNIKKKLKKLMGRYSPV